MFEGDGKSNYLTEGKLRASHRKPGQAPYDNFGLPYHSFGRADSMPLVAGQPTEVSFGLLPTAHRFGQKHRIRVTIALGDAGNFSTPTLDPAPRLRGTGAPVANRAAAAALKRLLR